MRVFLDTKKLSKNLDNLIDYSLGFVEGINKGKLQFFKILGAGVIEGLGQYIDSAARMNPEAMHHVYEWYETGSPEARLFDLQYAVSGAGLSLNSTFRQSRIPADEADAPFYNKARIMENGIPVVIRPKRSSVLAFDINGKTVFSSRPVTVNNPGGPEVRGEFERTFDEFFKNYFRQSFLKASGILDYLDNPQVYKKNFAVGVNRGGKSLGIKTGYTWITNAKVGIE